ncbi:hypothetical protein PVAP13_3NG141411 [Panicum virgatum]|uniref:Uncharacterized protein n=1 Tax=Panicum virgatum TaxID=38727 RepID=A0A8T0UF11_PANVG|nr:hypothetical protein PVAP13_3NG141411 [Panicum virgatum]
MDRSLRLKDVHCTQQQARASTRRRWCGSARASTGRTCRGATAAMYTGSLLQRKEQHVRPHPWPPPAVLRSWALLLRSASSWRRRLSPWSTTAKIIYRGR